MSAPNPYERFAEVNEQRLQRLFASVSGRQAERLRCLVLALHTGAEPSRPDIDAIARGIQGYQPDEQCLSAWHRQTGRAAAVPDTVEPIIDGLYVMGSSGTIAFNATSDFDIWVCCDPAAAAQYGEALRDRFKRLETWAEAANLETHFYLVTTDRFRGGATDAISKESSGSAQSLLLLDEFYRTAILLAGHPPLWWMVPPPLEAEYDAAVAQLVETNQLATESFIDFGGLADIPRDELHGAALWQIFKALESPHKAILKIMLMEAYAAQLPHPVPLSHDYKQLLLAEDPDPDLLDPYLMMYERIESYLLANGEQERLEMARRCLYIKVGEKLSRARAGGNSASEIMATYVTEWGWSGPVIDRLDAFGRWGFDELFRNYRAVVKELTACYARIVRLAKQVEYSNSIRSQDVQTLGRRIYAAFERRPGKVDLIHHPMGAGLAQATVGLRLSHGNAGQPQWALLSHAETSAAKPIHRASGLWELLAWGALNGVLVPHTRFLLDSGRSVLSARDLSAVVRALCRWLSPTTVREASVDDLNQRARVSHILIVRPPVGEPVRDSWYLHRTSWGEVLHRQFSSDDAIFGPLRMVLRELPLSVPATRLINTDQGKTGVDPLESLLNEAPDAAQSPDTLFLFPAPVAGYGLVWQDGETVRLDRFASGAKLLRHLGEPLGRTRHYRLWSGWNNREPLAALLQQRQDGSVQVFVSVRGERTVIYLIDELGALYAERTETFTLRGHLSQTSRFLENIMERERLMRADGTSIPRRYYRLDEKSGQWRVREVALNAAGQDGQSGQLHAFCPAPDAVDSELMIRCDDVEFSTLDWGERIYEQVARHLLSLRSNGERYPAHLTDLDFTDRGSQPQGTTKLQTGHYWRAKRLVEQRLTLHIRAITALQPSSVNSN